ncbi:hypothetical protein [Luteibacter yeojuensis]|uniref:Uncharacterized protein n=1 Tax=Luteibacter yeojuensis TaxID=345309 RepID=A0A0F3L089_9GAMM|nr:hypothetical protein [Luteibacter yeojuensis]KJV36955.1 hypothetical protein VI08_01805 [Luteibacter yeojuensis]
MLDKVQQFVVVLQIAGAALFSAAYGVTAWEMKRQPRRRWLIWKAQQRTEFGRRSLILGFLVAVACQLTWTFVAFWLAQSFDDACNYATFAAPCLAALLAGRTLVAQLVVPERPMRTAEFRNFFFSVLLLLFGYAAYLVHNASKAVVGVAMVGVLASALIPLIRRRVWRSSASPAANRLIQAALACNGLGMLIYVVHQVRA